MEKSNQELASFLAEWTDGPELNKKAFVELKEYLESKDGVVLSFHPRPGVTYSLRAQHVNQKEKPLFVMADVIEDDPRWLSVCFYGDMITDPDEKADFVPGGLLGEDGGCFDINQYDQGLINYIKKRLDEAYEVAAK
jgi:hypothetical protein